MTDELRVCSTDCICIACSARRNDSRHEAVWHGFWLGFKVSLVAIVVVGVAWFGLYFVLGFIEK